MSDLNIQLTRKQQEILLRGLRFVRSSIALDQQDWSPEIEKQREAQYEQIAEIERLLDGAKVEGTTARV